MKRRLSPGRTRRNGITLVDVVAALVILSVALPPLVSSFAESAMQTIGPAKMNVAALLAIERMEEIVARRNQANGYAQVVAANFPAESPVTDYPGFDRSVTVTEVAADLSTPQPGSGLKHVTVWVQWESGAREVQTDRLFADY